MDDLAGRGSRRAEAPLGDFCHKGPHRPPGGVTEPKGAPRILMVGVGVAHVNSRGQLRFSLLIRLMATLGGVHCFGLQSLLVGFWDLALRACRGDTRHS